MYKFLTYFSILCLCSFCVSTVNSQIRTRIKFNHLSNEDGLSSSSIQAIIQDKEGFIWFGTEDGLNRYDGYQFRVYKNNYQDSHSLSDNFINGLFIDGQDRLWISSSNGLNLYDPLKDNFLTYYFNATEVGNNIYGLVEDQAGKLWVSSNEGLFTHSKKENKFKRYIPQNPEMKNWPKNEFGILFVDKQNRLWISTQQHGLVLKNSNGSIESVEKTYPLLSSIRDAQVIRQDQKGNIWIGTAGLGLFKVHFDSHKVSRYEHNPLDNKSLSSNVVKSLEFDQQGQVWIGTENGGLNLYHEKEDWFHRYDNQPNNPSGISQKTISSIFEDRQGNIWLGTHRSGINYFNPLMDNFQFYGDGIPFRDLSYRDVKTFYEDTDGTILIGTDGAGLNSWNRKTDRFSYFKHSPTDENSIGSDAVLHIMKDRKGNLWVSTWGGGLNLFDRKSGTFKRFVHDDKRPQSISSNYVWRVFEDSKGNLWVATSYAGLNLFDPKKNSFQKVNWRNKKDPRIATGRSYYSIEEDTEGKLWLGADAGILHVYDPNSKDLKEYNFSEIPNYPSSTNAVRVIFKDSQNKLWFGQEGLFQYDKAQDRIVPIFKESNLRDEAIQGILEDDRGNLWISSKNGLYRYHLQTRDIKQFNLNDGLQGMEFGPNTCLKTADGELLFGGYNGFNVLDPDHIETNLVAPEIYFTDFQISHKSQKPNQEHSPLTQQIGATEEITLAYDQASFTIAYTALNFIASPKNQFAYKMVGLDKDWNYVKDIRSVTYTNLSPGDYIFKVKAANNDGLWNEAGKSIKISILPPFWQRWWFRAIVVSLALGIASFYLLLYRNLEIRKIKLLQQDEIHEVQSQFFTNISHEFRSPLTLIMGALENIRSNQHVEKSHRLMEKNAERLSGLINEVMDFHKIESGLRTLQVSMSNMNGLLGDIADDFEEIALQRNMKLQVDLPKIQKMVYCDRKVIEKIVLNLLNNAFKFSPDHSTVTISLLSSLRYHATELEPLLQIGQALPNVHYCHILVADQGIGIHKEASKRLFERFYRISNEHMGSGIGLAFVKSLVSHHRGYIQVFSRKDIGTEVIVSIPYRRSDYAEEEITFEEMPKADGELAAQTAKHERVSLYVNDNQNHGLHAEKILLIDDDGELRTFIRENLEQDYDIMEAENGEQALELLKEQLPDLIISDLMMPKMDGMELCQMLQGSPAHSHIPIIMLTAKEETSTKLEGLAHGASVYLTKPFSMKLLRLTIANLFKLGKNQKERHIQDFQRSAVSMVQQKRDEVFIHNLMEIMERHLDDPNLKVEVLSREMGMSQSKFYKKIKEITGYNISEYVRKTRMARARQILLSEDTTITQVMYRVGISSSSYFTSAFKKEFGLNPSDYMKGVRR